MVAARKNVAEATVPAAAQAAQAHIAKRTLWSPRTGLTEIFDDWKHETLMLLAALGFNSLEQLLAWLPPTKVQIAQPQGANTRTARTRDAGESTDIDDEFIVELAEYQRVNAEVFDIIYPSLNLDGTHKEKDRDQIRKYINGVLRDGRGLLEWALTWTDLGSFETQSALVLQLHQAKLPSNTTCMALYTFSNQLLKCWSRCAGNDPSSPSSLEVFWLQLITKLPTTPESSKIVLAHKWLVDRHLDKADILKDAPAAIERMCDYVKAHGLPSGGYNDELSRNFGGFDEKLVMGIGNDRGPNGGSNGKGNRSSDKRYTAETCDCSNCESFFCTKENRAKANGKCICDPNSTFDVRKPEYGIGPGGRRYVYLMRGYAKDNPGKKLKGVNFQLVKQAAKEKEKSEKPENAKKGDAPPADVKNSASVQSLVTIGDALSIQDDAIGEDVKAFLDEMDNLLPGVSMMASRGDDLVGSPASATSVAQSGGPLNSLPDPRQSSGVPAADVQT